MAGSTITFRYSVANRGSRLTEVVFRIEQLPGASLAIAPNPVPVKPGATVTGLFEISRPGGRRDELVSHFTIVSSTVSDHVTDSIPMTFLAPSEAK